MHRRHFDRNIKDTTKKYNSVAIRSPLFSSRNSLEDVFNCHATLCECSFGMFMLVQPGMGRFRAKQTSTAFEGIENSNTSFLIYTARRYFIPSFRCLSAVSNTHLARIITHAPLRAKEASPFVGGNQYPVVVCSPGLRYGQPINEYVRTTNTMP